MTSPLTLPLSTAEFFSVFARYNTAVWPAQTANLAMLWAWIARMQPPVVFDELVAVRAHFLHGIL